MSRAGVAERRPGAAGARQGQSEEPSPGRLHAAVEAANQTAVPYPSEASIPQLFARMAASKADDPALLFDGPQGVAALSYGALARRASRLARVLARRGVGPEVPVALAAERSPELVVSMLAVLEAGGFYVPLDPSYPAERQALMLRDSGSRLLLAAGAGPDPPEGVRRLVVAELEGEAAAPCRGEGAPPAVLGPHQLAYVMYTSGSTGRPKGVAVSHRNVVRLVRGSRFADLGPGCTFLQLAPVSFDASTLEIWGPLLNGGRLALMPRGETSPAEIAAAVERFGVDHLWLTAGLFHQVVDAGVDALAPLSHLLAGGDVLSPAHVRRVLGAHPHLVLVNGYGPTENTTFTTTHRVSAADGDGAVPIGRPVENSRTHVTGEDLREVPPGEEGELCAGGDGVARGYLGRPALTAERFVPDPFGPPGGRLYRTGDRARWRPAGGSGPQAAVLEFLGRRDQQVKVRGFRVEPGEVEAALSGVPGVGAAAVTVREPVPGDRRLVGYVTGRAGEPPPGETELRAALARRLPEHMVPSRFVALDRMPLTPNGKVDRRALPAPGAERPELAVPYRAPTGELEAGLAALWEGLLGLDRVGVDDDLFELGGHSLLAARIAARAGEAVGGGAALPIAEVFVHPTVAGLARRLEALRRGEGVDPRPPLVPVARGGDLPLSYPQEQVWFHQRLAPDSLAYNTQFTLRLRGPLDPRVLERALAEIVRRHESLRTTFHEAGGAGVQRVHPPWIVELALLDLSAGTAEEAAHGLEEAVGAAVAVPFDVARLPLVRWQLVRTAPDEHHLIHVEHHFIHDGGSVAVFLRELTVLYEAFRNGRPSPLPALEVQFGDFAAWQRSYLRGALLEERVDVFERLLEGMPERLDLPTDRPRPRQQSFRGARHDARLPPDLYADLRELSRRRGVTLFTTMLAAFEALLARWSGAPRFMLGSAVANRHPKPVEELIGMVVNTVVLPADLGGDPTFAALLERTRAAVVAAWRHQDTPVERLVARLQPERDLSRNPLFQVMFSFHDSPLPDLAFGGLEGEVVIRQNASSKADFNAIFQPRAEQRVGRAAAAEDREMRVLWEYSTDLFEAATVERLWQAYQRVLRQVVERPEARVSQLELLAPEEHEQVTVGWNRTTREHPLDLPLHRRVEEVAAVLPEAPAVVDADGTVTSYRDLLAAARGIAGELVRQGIGRGDRVAVCTGRTARGVAALLGVMRAGAAYLPLDPRHPRERLAWTLWDAGAAALLVDGATAALAPDPAAGPAPRVLRIDGEPAPPAASPAAEPDPLEVAYVVYTSGSTGRPKGVELTHAGLANLVAWHHRVYGLGEGDRCPWIAGPAFDASVWEIWPVLAAGAALHLPGDDVRADPERLRDWLVERRVTVAFLPTPLAERTVPLEWPAGCALRAVLTGGDVLHHAPPSGLPYRLVNHYGPTEGTVVATAGEVAPRPSAATAGDGARPHLGGPIDNVRAFVLDPWMRPVTPGVPGELWVGGAGLARGYLGRPALTADRFRPDPFSRGGRLYRSGDRVRWRAGAAAEGHLEFLGRVDFQVQVRGFRVEPGEVEAALSALPGVGAAVVVAFDAPAGDGDKRLAAYWQPAAGGGTAPEEEELRRRLAERLPDYMVPSAIVRLEALPLTRNGKVDRQALPQPREAASPAEHVAPRNDVEELVAELWSDVLGVAEVGVHDHFFRLGGHSMAATRMVSRLRDLLDLEIPLADVFDHPVLEQLAGRVERRLREDEVVAGGTEVA